MTRRTDSNPMRYLLRLSGVAVAIALAVASRALAHDPLQSVNITVETTSVATHDERSGMDQAGDRPARDPIDSGRHGRSEEMMRITSALIPAANYPGYFFHFPFYYSAPLVIRHFYVSADLNGPWVSVQEFEASAAGQFTVQAFVPASLLKGPKDRMDREFYLRDVPENGALSTTILVRGFIAVHVRDTP